LRFFRYGQVSDPNNTLKAADGLLFTSGTDLLGWNPNRDGTDGSPSRPRTRGARVRTESCIISIRRDPGNG